MTHLMKEELLRCCSLRRVVRCHLSDRYAVPYYPLPLFTAGARCHARGGGSAWYLPHTSHSHRFVMIAHLPTQCGPLWVLFVVLINVLASRHALLTTHKMYPSTQVSQTETHVPVTICAGTCTLAQVGLGGDGVREGCGHDQEPTICTKSIPHNARPLTSDGNVETSLRRCGKPGCSTLWRGRTGTGTAVVVGLAGGRRGDGGTDDKDTSSSGPLPDPVRHGAQRGSAANAAQRHAVLRSCHLPANIRGKISNGIKLEKLPLFNLDCAIGGIHGLTTREVAELRRVIPDPTPLGEVRVSLYCDCCASASLHHFRINC